MGSAHSLNCSVHSVASTSNNPITNDVQLNILVHDKLDKITKYKPFHRWKSKFLGRFETYLSESGRDPANEASLKLQRHLQGCLKRADILLNHIHKGDLSPITGKKTVRASLALNEFCQDLEDTRVEVRELVPAKSVDERRLGYTKFHVGASLIDEGFPQYVAMKELEEKVQEIADLTRDIENDEDILDKLQRELFRNYQKQVTRFCDVMADLDLYEIMLKCVHSEEEKIVIVDTKYGTMFSVDRETAIAKGVLTPKIVNDDEQFLEATEKDIDKSRMRKSMLSSPNLKVKPQIVVAKMKIEEYELEEAEKVQNLWGVNLKKTNHKKRGTEILFVDLKTEAVGFLNRTKLMDMEFITVVKVIDPNVLGDNKKGEVEETLEQAETDQQKYDFFVTRIRRIFGIAYEESLVLQTCESKE
eukprot:jgi/Psemu1/249511/estExt_Genewise1Plus.C_50236